MAHEKIKSLIVFVTIFAIVGGISWALVNAQQASQEQGPPQAMPKLRLHEDIRDAALNHVKDNHPETSTIHKRPILDWWKNNTRRHCGCRNIHLQR